MPIISKIVTAIHWKYQGKENKVETTDVYFNDGTKLALGGYWNFKVGESYMITYTNGNPVDIDNIRIKT